VYLSLYVKRVGPTAYEIVRGILTAMAYTFLNKGKIGQIHISFINSPKGDLQIWWWHEECSWAAAAARNLPMLVYEVSASGSHLIAFNTRDMAHDGWYKSPRMDNPTNQQLEDVLRWFSTFEINGGIHNGLV
jgi:hypothetical protein